VLSTATAAAWGSAGWGRDLHRPRSDEV